MNVIHISLCQESSLHIKSMCFASKQVQRLPDGVDSGGVGARCDDAELHPPAECVDHPVAQIQTMRARHSPKPIGTKPLLRQCARKITSSPSSRKVRISPEGSVICRVPSALSSIRLP